MKVQIIVDSTVDMPEHSRSACRVVPLTVHFGEESFIDGVTLNKQDFYRRLAEGGALPTTSQATPAAFQSVFDEVTRAGDSAVVITLASQFSGTYQSACIAAEDLKSEYPDAKIVVIDSLSASRGQGMLLYRTVQERRRSSPDIETLAAYVRSILQTQCHWFIVDDLNHLKRGGRISAATALFGTMLSIKPVMHVDDEGRLIPVSKARGRRASLLALVDRMAQTAIDPANQTVFISHGDCLEDAEFVASELRRRLNVQTIHINYVGPVIGNHSGPGTMALFFLASER